MNIVGIKFLNILISPGAFFSEGSYTKNSVAEVDFMMSQLEKWSKGDKPSIEESARLAALKLPLKATPVVVDIPKFMGRWYVLANIPLSVEVGASNCVENYTWNEQSESIDVLFEYTSVGAAPAAPKAISEMHAKIVNNPVNSFWALILHSLFFIHYSLFFILYSLLFILYSLFFILHPLSFIHYRLFFILYSLFFILNPLFFILYPLFFILYSLIFILYLSSFILYPSFFILHPLFIILHPLIFILYPLFFIL